MAANAAANGEEGGKQEPKYRGWKAMPYVIGNETFEKLGTIGTSSNLLVYLTTVFHMKSVSAATLLNVWNGTTNIATLLGAFLCDSYFGRYKTLAVACVASFLGMVMLALTAAVSELHPSQCDDTAGSSSCGGPTEWQYSFLLVGLGFLVVGAGGIRPCNLAFGADQFDPTTESGKRGINSFFNWYYFTFTIAMMISATVIIYVQTNISWALGLAIPAGLMFLSCAFFFVGSRVYVKVKPEGSPFTGVLQVFVAAVRKRGLGVPGKEELFNPPVESKLISTLPHTDQFRFLDKAAVIEIEEPEDEIEPNPWRLCSLQQVEAVKCLIRVIPIWACATTFYISVVQLTTYSVFQALQSDRRLTRHTTFLVPAGSFIVFNMLAVTIWIPIYDRLIIPRLRTLTGREEGITLLQRIGAGIAISALAMVAAGLAESRRRGEPPLPGSTAPGGGAVSSLSSMWVAPQLAVAGLAEAFAVIGQVEFYYKQFPENMRSVAGSLLFCGMAVANYASGFMIAVVHRATARGGRESWLAEDLNRGRLDYFYYVNAGIAVVNLCFFLVFARWYRYKGKDDEYGSGGGVAVEMSDAKTKTPPV